MIDVYWTGMAQPAKSTIRAPWATCQSKRGVLSSVGSILASGREAEIFWRFLQSVVLAEDMDFSKKRLNGQGAGCGDSMVTLDFS